MTEKKEKKPFVWTTGKVTLVISILTIIQILSGWIKPLLVYPMDVNAKFASIENFTKESVADRKQLRETQTKAFEENNCAHERIIQKLDKQSQDISYIKGQWELFINLNKQAKVSYKER